MEYANRTVKMDTFCFYGNGDHRDLHVLTHSFPTRRTSDLRRGGRCRRAGTRDVRPCPMIPLPPTTRIYLACGATDMRSEEHTSELQSLMRISYAVFCLKKKISYIYKTNLLIQHN